MAKMKREGTDRQLRIEAANQETAEIVARSRVLLATKIRDAITKVSADDSHTINQLTDALRGIE